MPSKKVCQGSPNSLTQVWSCPTQNLLSLIPWFLFSHITIWFWTYLRESSLWILAYLKTFLLFLGHGKLYFGNPVCSFFFHFYHLTLSLAYLCDIVLISWCETCIHFLRPDAHDSLMCVYVKKIVCASTCPFYGDLQVLSHDKKIDRIFCVCSDFHMQFLFREQEMLSHPWVKAGGHNDRNQVILGDGFRFSLN